MKNKNLIIIAVVIILLLGAGLIYAMNQTKTPQPVTQDQNANPQTENTTENTTNKFEEIEGSLKSLLSGGKNIKCTYTNTTEEISMTGTVYAANGKVRQDYQSNTSAGNMSGHMIVESQDAYMWTDQMSQGFKFSIAGQPTPAVKDSKTPDIDTTMRFSCEPWAVDNSVFTLPSNITFQSMTVPVVPTGTSAGQAATGSTDFSDQCAVCNNIPEGPGRTACKSQLKCP